MEDKPANNTPPHAQAKLPHQTILLDINDVKHQTGIRSTQTIYTKMKTCGFPRPISIGNRSNRWILKEVEEWVQDRIKESRRRS